MEALETPSSAPAEQPLAGSVSGAPQGDNGGSGAAAPAAPNLDPAVAERLAEITKSYKEIQGFSTKQAQSNAELRRQLSELQTSHKGVAEMLRKAMQAPHDPAQFEEEWRKNPTAVLDRLLKDKLDGMQKGFEDRVSSQGATIDQLTVSSVIKDYRSDATNHPDFAKLEAEMAEITRTPGLAPDPKLPAEQYVEALYQAAKNRHAQDALKAAEDAGRKKAEEALAKESRTTIAGGGKQVALTSDPSKMSAAQLKAAILKADPSLGSDGY